MRRKPSKDKQTAAKAACAEWGHPWANKKGVCPRCGETIGIDAKREPIMLYLPDRMETHNVA